MLQLELTIAARGKHHAVLARVVVELPELGVVVDGRAAKQYLNPAPSWLHAGGAERFRGETIWGSVV